MRVLRWETATVLAASVALFATPATAGPKGLQYSAVLSCGSSDGGAGSAPGDYYTTVSVLNGGSADVSAQARVALTSSDASSDTIGATLAPGEALQLDCEDLLGGIFTFPAPVTGFAEGFVLIQSSAPLHVVAKYSTSRADAVSSQVVPIAGSPLGKPWKKRDRDRDEEQICHVPPGNPSNRHTITVGRAAVPAHLSHGDHRGACDDDD